jgi:hypothetical protein
MLYDRVQTLKGIDRHSKDDLLVMCKTLPTLSSLSQHSKKAEIVLALYPIWEQVSRKPRRISSQTDSESELEQSETETDPSESEFEIDDGDTTARKSAKKVYYFLFLFPSSSFNSFLTYLA